uniref:Ion transport domain-containing protein n=1 Tax=Anopheles atroparvus TaxID=41427 RepID=A0A240PNW2_ANOAO
MNRSKYKPVYFRTFPLHHAAANCNVVEVQRQLDAGANPYQPTEEGLTALHAAVANNSVAVVDLLLKRYVADISIASDTVRHRFLWKAEQVEWKKRPILIAWTEEDCQATLVQAASCPAGIPLNLQVFVLLRQPQEGHYFVALDVCNRSKRTDTYAKKEIIAMLIGKGASLAFHSGEDHSTPFMAACDGLRKDFAAFLAENYLDRFDPGACNNQDYNALHKMFLRQHTGMVERIVQIMLNYRMSKHRETKLHALSQIFRYDAAEYKYISIWSFANSAPMKKLCSKYIILGQFDLRTRFEGSTLLGTCIERGIALDYCLQEIEADLDLLRMEEDHTGTNVLHKLIRCKRLSFVNDLYSKHESVVKEIFEIENSVYKPAFDLLEILVQNMDEDGLVFVLEQHRDYYLKDKEHLVNLTIKKPCMNKAAHERLCEITIRKIPQLEATLADWHNSSDWQDNGKFRYLTFIGHEKINPRMSIIAAFNDLVLNLRDSFTKTIEQLEANDRRLDDYVDSNGRTLLHAAVDFCAEALVKKLLARHFDVKKKDAKGCLPIHLVRRSESIFEMLLAENETGQLEYINDAGYNLLHISCKNGLSGAPLEKLLEHGMDVNDTAPDGHLPLSLASCCGTVRFLVNHGARVELLNEHLFSDRLPNMNYCAVWELIPHIATADWFKSCAHLLLPWMVGNEIRERSNERDLEKHEDIRRVIFDSFYQHSMEEASKLFSRVCHNAIVCCARWFLEYDYDLDYDCRYWNCWNSTPLLGLFTYLEEPNFEVVEKLLHKSVDVNAVDDRKRTPLIALAEFFKFTQSYGHSLETFRLLLKKEAKLDEQDYSGNTALHYAFQWEQWELVEFLIESGAKTSIKNASNKLASEMVSANSRCLFGFIR